MFTMLLSSEGIPNTLCTQATLFNNNGLPYLKESDNLLVSAVQCETVRVTN